MISLKRIEVNLQMANQFPLLENIVEVEFRKYERSFFL